MSQVQKPPDPPGGQSRLVGSHRRGVHRRCPGVPHPHQTRTAERPPNRGGHHHQTHGRLQRARRRHLLQTRHAQRPALGSRQRLDLARLRHVRPPPGQKTATASASPAHPLGAALTAVSMNSSANVKDARGGGGENYLVDSKGGKDVLLGKTPQGPAATTPVPFAGS